MNSFFKFYSLPGKLIAEIWYLWPKKGQILASNRRREHAFVHFTYSTVFYLVTIILIAGVSGERRTKLANETPQAAIRSAQGVRHQVEDQPYSQSTPAAAHVEKAELEIPKGAETQSITFESNPVVQEIPASEEASLDGADEAKSTRKTE